MTKPLILMYHRVAVATFDYWGLAVSPTHFEEHLSVIRRTRHPFPLVEFVERLIAGTLPPDALALTFDDGYVDNLTVGLPLLSAADVPATAFLATGFLDRPEPFWWDELEWLTLREAPKGFKIEIDQQIIQFEPASGSTTDESSQLSDSVSADSRAVLELLYEPLRSLGDDERRVAMSELRAILSRHNDCLSLGRPMTSDKARSLAASGLVTIGAHTVTHPVLSRLDPTACRDEVVQSKLACEAIAAAAVAAFCYPYGDFDDTAREAMRDADFAMACSTRRGAVGATSDVLAMPRIYVSNLDGDAFHQRIRWASTLADG